MKPLKCLTLACLMLAAVLLPAVMKAQFAFTTNNGTISILGYTGSKGAVAIPGTIEGLSVSSIGDWAFYATSVTSILIPDAVTNLGDAINGWNLTWSFTAGQTIAQLWNGSVTQSGAQVTVTNVSYNASISTGSSTTFGFNGSYSGTHTAPTVVSCTSP